MSNKYYSQLMGEKYSCPCCNSTKIEHDTSRSEIYCSECGLVISNPSGDGVLPWDYSEERTTNTGGMAEITNFRHTYTNTQLMKHGMKRRR